MSYILTLIAERETGLLTPELLASLGAPAAGDWSCLSEGEAYELPVTQPLDLTSLLADKPIDWAITPAEGRRKKLLLADMDSTMIKEECVDEIADHLGVGPKVAEITQRAMNGDLEFEPALRERVALLKGLPISDLEEIFKTRIHCREGGRTLVQTMRAHGAKAALVSGGFTFFTTRVSAALGFEASRANTLNENGGVLDGTVGEPILGPEAKVEALTHYCKEYGLTHDEVIAAGDGSNDVGMIRAVGLGVAIHAKPVLEREADACIRHTGLTSLLFLQGYRRDEFITE
ncbi:MAG: phosphoserine phosphatase SerB [Alphaproteobacteria bacterium]|nr:MAG: phosphoserine phosphatase SerB [Alphaproteobacteria bacterium]